MKLILSVLLTLVVIVALLVKKLRAHIGAIMVSYAIIMIGLFCFYNYRTADIILPFYKPVNQAFYQNDFIKDGEYTDAALWYILRDKTVIIPFSADFEGVGEDSFNDVWLSGKITDTNYENIFSKNGARVERIHADTFWVPDEHKDEFKKLGYLNDALRYSFMYNDFTSEFGNAFYYYWAYSTQSAPIELFLNIDDIDKDDVYYLMFDENVNLYLTSENYYDWNCDNND